VQLRGGQLERGSVVGGYRIDELISRGGMGVVYRATNVALNRIYALKVLAPELADDDGFQQRFKREMRIAASLHHPSVVGIHYAGEHEGLLFFVMDYVPGSDLRDVLQKTGALDPDRAVELLAQSASALDAAHARGLVHRDVKPANILITVKDGEEHAYLTDFGVAKRSETLAGLTAKGAVVGTVDYMSPEQITGDHTDARTDIYALGCVFFQMLTGNLPYERENSVAKLFAHVHEPPPPLEGPLAASYPALGPVIEKATAKEPRDRYLSAGDFARDAAAALEGARYTGRPSIVATGEARPSVSGEAYAERAPTASGAAPSDLEPTTAAGGYEEALSAPVSPNATRPSVGHQASVERPPTALPHDQGTGSASRSLRRYRWPAVGLLVLVGGALAAIVALSSGGSPTVPAGQGFAAAARPVPTNRVHGAGSAAVRLQGDVVTVSLHTSGLLNGSAHAMHIHAGGQGICPPASAARLHNGHLAISTTDGIKFYGPPEAALTTSGDTSPKSIVDFPRYPSVGDIRYKRTLTVPPGIAAAIRAGNAVIVVHGIDYNHNGIYDDVLNRSELDSALPGEATAPALCGPLFNTQTTAAVRQQHSTGGTTYTASLRAYVPSPSEQSSSLWLLCHLAGLAVPASVSQTATDSEAGKTA
jgi:serine/threonine protein kinase